MGKKYIISENQYNLLLEQNSKLNYLVGKKVNLYYDAANSRLAFTATIKGADKEDLFLEPFPFFYPNANKIGEPGFVNVMYFRCNYSTGLVDSIKVFGSKYRISDEERKENPYMLDKDSEGIVYNKKLTDEINLKKLINCSKPKADYSSTNPKGTQMA